MNVSNEENDAATTQSTQRVQRQDNRGLWRIGANDIEDYVSEAYRRTAARIAAGELKDEEPGTELA